MCSAATTIQRDYVTGDRPSEAATKYVTFATVTPIISNWMSVNTFTVRLMCLTTSQSHSTIHTTQYTVCRRLSVSSILNVCLRQRINRTNNNNNYKWLTTTSAREKVNCMFALDSSYNCTRSMHRIEYDNEQQQKNEKHFLFCSFECVLWMRWGAC